MKWLVSYLVGIAVSVTTAIILAFVFGNLNTNIAITSLGAGVFFSIYVLQIKTLPKGIEKKDLGFWSYAVIIVYLLFCLRAFLWLIFKVGDSVKVLSPNNLGDISLHINYIEYLANGARFWPLNPVFSGDKIRYPFGIDLFNSLLVLVGVDIIHSLIWVGLIGAIATGFALLLWGRAFTLAGFLFNGGLAGFQFFQHFKFSDYQTDLAWKSLMLTMLIPQRGFLYALPAGLLLLYSWKNRFFCEDSNIKSKEILPLWIEVLLYSTMPIFHLHTFIFLSLLLGLWFLFSSLNTILKIIKLIIFSVIPATVFVLLLTNLFKASSVVYVKLGWMQGKENFFKFWLLNFGIFLPLVILLCYFLITKDKNKTVKAFVFPAVILFLLFTNIMLAPWEWDNCKLLIWSYLILLPFVWENLIVHWNKYIQYALCFILFFSGFVCIHGGFKNQQGNEIFKYSEIALVNQAVKSLPVDGLFAAFPNWNHPLIYAGRRVVLGYPGWMWSHGYKMEGRDEKLRKLMLGDKDWQILAKELGVKYIFWGKQEEMEYKDSLKPWENQSVLIASGAWGKIFNVSGNIK